MTDRRFRMRRVLVAGVRRHGPGVARWAWPLLATAGTVYAVWRAFLHYEFAPQDDAWLLAYVGGGYLVAVAFLLIFTRGWTVRALGQLTTYLADAGLYLSASLPQLGWRRPSTAGEINLIRAGFVVGVTLLIVGLVWWGVRTHGGTRRSRARFWRREAGAADEPMASAAADA